MSTKELTTITRDAIEDVLTSQGITVTSTTSRYINEVLQDHNTAYRQTVIIAITDCIRAVQDARIPWTRDTVVAVLQGIISRMYYL